MCPCASSHRQICHCQLASLLPLLPLLPCLTPARCTQARPSLWYGNRVTVHPVAPAFCATGADSHPPSYLAVIPLASSHSLYMLYNTNIIDPQQRSHPAALGPLGAGPMIESNTVRHSLRKVPLYRTRLCDVCGCISAQWLTRFVCLARSDIANSDRKNEINSEKKQKARRTRDSQSQNQTAVYTYLPDCLSNAATQN